MSPSTILQFRRSLRPQPLRKSAQRRRRLLLEQFEDRRLLATFVVNTSLDNLDFVDAFGRDEFGSITLRGAISAANRHNNADNANGGPDVIEFNIPGSGVQTIPILEGLPLITDPVIIDGTTQPGYLPQQPLIELDGSQAGFTNGLTFKGGGNTVEGLIINNFGAFGLLFNGASDPVNGPAINNNIQANLIGTDSTGKIAKPNNAGGIKLDHSAHNLIGGLNLGSQLVSGNLISGNAETGIFLADSDCTGNYIEGNYIGTDITGLAPISNAPDNVDGVFLGPPNAEPDNGFPSGNFIGDFDPTFHDFNPHGRNIISGNSANGIYVLGGSGNVVAGNYIGLGADGFTPVSNTRDGVRLEDASLNTVGGTDPNASNVISANDHNGIEIVADAQSEEGMPIEVSHQSASGNVIQGNFIGTDATGTLDVVTIADSLGDEHLLPLGNTQNGIAVCNLAGDPSVVVSLNVIGGDIGTIEGDVQGRNIISGNFDNGILLAGGNLSANTIKGNYIGTDVVGELDRPNSNFGILLDQVAGESGAPTGNFIGGPTASGGNVISGNGTLASGGDLSAGGGVGIRNGASANFVQNNRIGTDKFGQRYLPNAVDGVKIEHASNNTIGGFSPHSGAGSNLISGNEESGIEIIGGDAMHNQVIGNYIGTDDTGENELSNGLDGVLLAAPDNTIGSSSVFYGNVISGNLYDGIQLSGADANHNIVNGNDIGTDFTGLASLGNHRDGVELDDAPDNIIGDPDTFVGNTISGNDLNGVRLNSAGTTGNLIAHNEIGTTAGAVGPLENFGDGILIVDASDNTIGGIPEPNEPAFETPGNAIGGNGFQGIYITGSSTKNRILGNFIGFTTDPYTGTVFTGPVGNGAGGIYIAASNNTIGGTQKGAGNQIAYNGQDVGTRGFGISVASGIGNSIRGNSIFANAGRGIDLGDDPALHLNDIGDGDAGPNDMQNYPYITDVVDDGSIKFIYWRLNSTPSTSLFDLHFFDIDFYSNQILTDSGFGDGTTYLYSERVITDVNGIADFLSIVPSDTKYIAATATDSAGNTSEFSMVDSDADGLADSWELNGIDVNGDGTTFYQLPGAEPLHKDLYVEVDAMENDVPEILLPEEEPPHPGNTPTNTVLDKVVDAFYHSPVTDPDGSMGINLHVQLDETNIPTTPWTGDLDGDGVTALQGDTKDMNGFPYFYALKAGTPGQPGGFGTVNERNDPAALKAKSLAYRYSVFADRFATFDENGNVIVDTSGISEYDSKTIGTGADERTIQTGGNDFMVTLGAWGNVPATFPYNLGDEQAGTFMHELGHTLGLGHGGGDDTNGKPNYHSVMNYLWQMPSRWMYESVLQKDVNGDGNKTDSTWTLDYSRQQYSTLDESLLNELGGIGGNPNQWIWYPYNAPLFLPDGSPNVKAAVTETSPIDWNQDGVIEPPTLPEAADINGDKTKGEILIGQDDWSQIQFGFRESPFFNGQAHGETAPGGELTFDQWERDEGLIPVPASPGSLALTLPTYDVHENAGSITIGVTRTGGGSGPVSVHYTTSAGTATDGADYAETSGDLNFADGQLGATIKIPIVDDSLAEGDETFTITLSSPTGGAVLGITTTATVTIDDDELTHGTTYTVTNALDSGPGSLRQAILEANSHLGTDTIAFAIAGGTIILPESPLPSITDAVTIDATTQPGYAGTPLVQITGLLAGDNAAGLTVQAGHSIVKGLIIDGFNIGLELDSSGNTISGNWIGPQLPGIVDLSNGADGILIAASSSGNIIGGAGLFDRNVVSHNVGTGIVVAGSGNTLSANFVGTDATGMQSLANSTGIVVSGANNAIGGSSPGLGNLISGNAGDGLDIVGPTATGSIVQGNVIGLDAAHGHTVLNGGDGIALGDQASQNLIGGTSAGAGNTINNDNGYGIHLEAGATQNQLQGNLITTGIVTADQFIISGPAIFIENSTSNTIGGIAAGAGNEIHSFRPGVVIDSGVGNAIRGNAIYVSETMGIDLGDDFRTSNDPGDADTGPNQLQNFPVVSTATLAGGNSVVITGDLNSTPKTTFSIDLYSSFDSNLSGELYATTIQVTTDSTGHVHWTASVPTTALGGYYVTATATDPAGNTSEFSDNLELDVDGDGVFDSDEALAPNNGDANADGVPDRFEANVASIIYEVTLVAPAGTQFRNVDDFVSQPPGIPSRARLPLGMMTWQLQGVTPGAAVTVELLVGQLQFGGPINFNAYYRFGPTPGKPSGWDIFAFDGTTGAEINGQKITLHLIDGGHGDDDLAPNGVIKEQGAPTDGPETFVVTNTNDSGPGSLRQAIIDSNSHGATDTIAFAIGSGPQTIAPLTVLPDLFDPVTIDATTQPGYAGTPLITLTGTANKDVLSSAFEEPFFHWAGLTVRGGSITVRGLSITGFTTRSFPVGNNAGPFVPDGAGILVIVLGGNRIEDNTLSGNTNGAQIGNGNLTALGNNVIAGNTITLNTKNGVLIRNDNSGNRVGGTTPADRNVISGNGFYGVEIDNRANNNLIEGDYIGVQADGVSPEGNGLAGIDVLQFGTIGNTIGGTAAGAGNVIAYNGGTSLVTHNGFGFGVVLEGSVITTQGNPVLGNSIFDNFGPGISGGGGTDVAEGDETFKVGGQLISVGSSLFEMPNFPILNSASQIGGNTVIEGRISAQPAETYRIELFSNSDFDPSSFGEGKTFLGAINVTTDATGNGTFTSTLPTINPADRFVTGTVTAANGATSPFSARLAIGDALGSVIVVNTADDHDDGVADAADTSLREAIIAANNHPGVDVIRFSIGSGVQTIRPKFNLPAVIDPVIIDGTSQPGYQGSPLIVLTGTYNPANRDFIGPAGAGLRLAVGGATVRGLVLNSFSQAIVAYGGGGNVIQGCFIGTDATGRQGTASGDAIALGYDSPDNVIGGTTPDARNVISSNHGTAITIQSPHNVIQGNFIGTDVTGTRALPNLDGIHIEWNDNTIGGTTPGARNIISGNSEFGLSIAAPGVGAGNVVQGNFIGTDVTGTQPIANGVGVFVDLEPVFDDTQMTEIGGTAPGAGNLISGNSARGIFMTFAEFAAGVYFGVDVKGNLIGTDVTGTEPLPNGGDGLFVQPEDFQGTGLTSPEVNIGGTDAGAGNTIAFNFGRGVNVGRGRFVTIVGNSIFSNSGLGIDLAGDGVTQNDPGDGDIGSNDLQNFPVITTAFAGATTRVSATLNSLPNSDFLISFYASDAADPTGFGEGQRYLGSTAAHTDASGTATINLNLPVGTTAGQFLTATSTDSGGSTSEFSQAVQFAVSTGDTTPPTITGAPDRPANSEGWYSAPVIVSFTASDLDSGIASVTGPVTLSGEGAHQSVTGTATDNAANSASTTVGEINIDLTKPTTASSIVGGTLGTSGWYTSSVAINLVASDNLSGIMDTFFQIDGGAQQTYVGSPFTVGGDFVHTITFWSVDKAGNVENTESLTVKIDTTPPTITGAPDRPADADGWYNAPVTVTFTATDDDSGLASVTNPVTLSGEGTNQSVTGTATDNAGNSASTTLGGINIDLTQPTTTASIVSGTLGNNGWYTSNVTIGLSAIDNLSGVKNTLFQIDGGSQQTYAATPFLVSGDLVHTITFWSVDKAGNTENSESLAVKIDKSAPTITGSPDRPANAEGWYSAPVTVTFSASDVLSGLASLTSPVTLSGQGAAQSATGTAIDNAGNSASATVFGINIDLTKPLTTATVASGTLGNSGWYTSDVTLRLSPSDNLSGIKNTFFRIDGGTQQTYAGTPFSVGGDLVHTITFWSVDNAGNTEDVESFTVKIDKTPPTITVSPPSAPVAAAGLVTYTVSYRDANFQSSNLSLANVHLVSAGSAAGTLSFDSGNGATRTVTIGNITGRGSLGISIDAGSGIDAAGNVAPSAIGTSFTVGIGNAFILLLDPTSRGALTATGNAALVLAGGGSVIIDSSNAAGAVATGNATVTGAEFDITGSPGTSTSGHGTFQGTIHTGVTPTMDPLASLPVPVPPTATFGAVNYSGKSALTLSPGTYVGGIHLSGQGNVTLLPGIYYLQGGGFSVTGKGKLTGYGVMIYNSPAKCSDAISISGQGAVTLTPPGSGAYQGITIFQDRNSAAPLSLSGNGAMTITGTLYAAGATLHVTGNGGFNAQGIPIDTMGSEYIVDDLSISGNGSIRLSGAPASTRFSVVDGSARAVYRYDSAGNALGLSNLVDASPAGIASSASGDTLWVVDADKNIYVYAAAGSFSGSWTSLQLSRPQDIATDGTDLWILDGGANRVYHYAQAASRLSGTLAPTDSFSLDVLNGSPSGLAIRGQTLWVTNDQASATQVFVYATNGTKLGSWSPDPANTDPTGITLDPAGGSDLWVVDRQAARVFHYAGAQTWRSGSHRASDRFALSAGDIDAEGIADPPTGDNSAGGIRKAAIRSATGQDKTYAQQVDHILGNASGGQDHRLGSPKKLAHPTAHKPLKSADVDLIFASLTHKSSSRPIVGSNPGTGKPGSPKVSSRTSASRQ